MGKFSDALSKSEKAAKDERPAASPPKAPTATIPKEADKPPVRKPPAPVERTAAERVSVKQEAEALQELSLDRIDPRLACCLEAGSPAAEAFKMLRAKILTRDAKSRPRTIMVTSAQPFDGKSMVAANLAISIAQGVNEHVVLVDCDLRKPSVDKILGFREKLGIREFLEDGTSVGLYLRKTGINKLTVLPAGKACSNPGAILSSNKMRDLIEELKSRYEDRYIIIDATPAQFAAETTFLASMVDAIILVIRAGKTAKDVLLSALENIGRDKLLGVVFNASRESSKSYRYYYNYYSRK